MAGVLVFGEIAGGQVTAVSLEVAGAGAAVARALNGPLQGALIGAHLTAAVERFRSAVHSLYLVEGDRYRQNLAHAHVAAAEAAIEACKPAVVLFTHTLATREWVPQLAARLDAGLVMDCTALAIEGDALIATKPVYGGSVLGESVMRGAPRLATIRLGAFPAAPATSVGEIHRIDPPAGEQTGITFIGETTAAAGTGASLKDAKIVVAGGRGLGAAENWRYIDEIASRGSGRVLEACGRFRLGVDVLPGGPERDLHRGRPVHCRRHIGGRSSISPASVPSRRW